MDGLLMVQGTYRKRLQFTKFPLPADSELAKVTCGTDHWVITRAHTTQSVLGDIFRKHAEAQ